MQTLRNHSFWKRIVAASFAVPILSLAGPGPSAIDQEPAAEASLPKLRHGLEGMRFSGPLAVKDETNPPDDVLSFEGGKLASKKCLEYGFVPAPYWLRGDADGLHFRAELRSTEHGTIRFEGVFDGREMLATAVWTKKRWYWTIEQRLRFTGRPIGPTN
jgi:hypothetical protein